LACMAIGWVGVRPDGTRQGAPSDAPPEDSVLAVQVGRFGVGHKELGPVPAHAVLKPSSRDGATQTPGVQGTHVLGPLLAMLTMPRELCCCASGSPVGSQGGAGQGQERQGREPYTKPRGELVLKLGAPDGLPSLAGVCGVGTRQPNERLR
jgi:hypothetical protein